MDRLLIIDGHNLLFQMFFGMPSKIIGAQGHAIQGVIGFVGAVNRLTEAYQPTHLVIIFDGEKNNPRKDILKEYKANRIDYSELSEDENPFSQLPYIYQALDYMGIKWAETTVCEADDIIAGYAIQHGKECEVLISSFDSDYFQLITDKIKIVRYRGKCSQICDEKYINEKYGISPERYLDYKCLVGDSADNICGIRGIGPKTASKLINEFGDINSIKEKSHEITSEKIRHAIDESHALLERNEALIKLQGGASLPFALEEIAFTNPRIRTMDIIRGIGH